MPAGAADPPGVVHASVPRDDVPERSAGGGAARTVEAATTAAVAEAIERFAATHATVPVRRAGTVPAAVRIRLDDCTLHSAAQRADPAFPYAAAYPRDEWLSEVFDLTTNEPRWVPAALVSLVDDYGPLATSSGLAAGGSVVTALLRAVQELVERDAFVTTWLHQLGGREVTTPDLAAELESLGGELRVFDLTPAFSPHPVAAVTGTAPLRGMPRHSLGVACRARWEDAVEKAVPRVLPGHGVRRPRAGVAPRAAPAAAGRRHRLRRARRLLRRQPRAVGGRAAAALRRRRRRRRPTPRQPAAATTPSWPSW